MCNCVYTADQRKWASLHKVWGDLNMGNYTYLKAIAQWIFLWSKTALGLFPQFKLLVLAQEIGIKLIQMFTVGNLSSLSKYALLLCFCLKINILVIQKMVIPFFWNQNIGCKFTNLNPCEKYLDVSLSMSFTLKCFGEKSNWRQSTIISKILVLMQICLREKSWAIKWYYQWKWKHSEE